MKRTIGILDLIIFLLSIIVLLIAFFMNMDKLSLLIGVGLIILLGIAHTRLEKITGLSSENPKIKTMRRMNRLSMVFVVILYLIPLVKKDLIGNVPYQFFLLITIMIFSGNIAPKLPFNKYMGLRLPWITRDENTWKIANRLLGYLTFPLVLIMAILYFCFNKSDIILLIGIIFWIGIPAIYSLIKYNKIKKERN